VDTKQKASLFAVSLAFILASSKFVVGLVSGSMAVASSGVDSLLDVFMSGMNFYAIKKASEPADAMHRYGHEKAEDVAGVIESMIIIGSGTYIIHASAEKYLQKASINYSPLDLGVMVLSLLASFAISFALRRVGTRTGSNALKADALHYTSDLYSNSAAIVAILLTYYTTKTYFDLIFAVVTGLIIMFSAGRILKNSLSGLMDTSIPDELQAEIGRIIETTTFPYAGYHKLRTRSSGNKKYIDFHLLVCKKATIDEAHELASRVENEIARRLVTIDIVTHTEPCFYKCELTEETCVVLKTRQAKQVQEKPQQASHPD
jgi:ferrous-iron efflux pump FieF